MFKDVLAAFNKRNFESEKQPKKGKSRRSWKRRKYFYDSRVESNAHFTGVPGVIIIYFGCFWNSFDLLGNTLSE